MESTFAQDCKTLTPSPSKALELRIPNIDSHPNFYWLKSPYSLSSGQGEENTTRWDQLQFQHQNSFKLDFYSWISCNHKKKKYNKMHWKKIKMQRKFLIRSFFSPKPDFGSSLSFWAPPDPMTHPSIIQRIGKLLGLRNSVTVTTKKKYNFPLVCPKIEFSLIFYRK